jgi:hypothetical protein
MLQNKSVKEREKTKFGDDLLHLIAFLKVVETIDTRDLQNLIFIAQELSWMPKDYDFGYCYADFPAPYSSHLCFDLGVLQYKGLVTNRELEEPICLTEKGNKLVNEDGLKDIKSKNIKTAASLDSDSLASIAAYLQIVRALKYDSEKAFEKAKYIFEEDIARELKKTIEELKNQTS